MSTSAHPPPPHTPTPLQRRIPNALTVGRLVLTAAFVALLSFYQYPDGSPWILPLALALFVVAAISDALDGYLARKWNAVSVFGRVVDPAADKVLVLGALVFLASPIFYAPALGRVVTGVEPWMVAVILTREFMVTSMRAVLESEGVSFAANASGKIKMIVQSIATPLAMLLVWLADPASLLAGGTTRWALDLVFWGLTLLTILSSLPYAMGLLRHMADARSPREIKP